MTWSLFKSVRSRLWAAFALLSLAVLAIGAVTWASLERVDKRLQDLHRQTLSQVAQALDLSKRSTDLATSAPYLLNQRSNFLINQEGQKLLDALAAVSADWPEAAFGGSPAETGIVSEAIDRMAFGVTDLIAAASTLDTIQTDLQVQTARLGDLRDQASLTIGDPDMDDRQRLTWWKLQSMTSDALSAAYVGNLIGVGEDQRQFLAQKRNLGTIPLTAQQEAFLMDLDRIVGGPSGVFEQRRQELSTIMGAQNALFRLRFDAGVVSTSASNFALAAEQFLAQERTSSSSTIQLTKLGVSGIALASLGLALVSALYVSRYVTYNMGRISAAMVQLAEGDRSSSLPRKFPNKDEIGDLFRSFRIFRANALRLDRSNRQLDQRNALFQKVFTNISDGISITDATGRITAQNPAMRAILGLQNGPQIGKSFISRLRSGTFGAAAETAGITDAHRGYCELESLDGQHVELRASRLPDDGRVWLCADVTERRRLTDRLQQIDRIEALGKVAGDTAHDFGNILSTIATHAHLLEVDETLAAHPSLSAIKNATEYGGSLTQRLLAFAKKQHLAPEVVDLNTLVEGIVDLVEISLKQEVAFEVRYAGSPLCVRVDPGQLESALLNLLLNANQAIADQGKIRVDLGLSANKAASIRITDTGIGMSADILNRVVEPFFTTRSHDGGTGLGLSIAYGFIRQTGGDLRVSSVVGEGTEIDITLPLAEPISPVLAEHHGKHALVVEDEGQARQRAQRALEALGFIVTACADGNSARDELTRKSFDALVTDLDLGEGVSGWDLVELYLSQNPTNQAIVVSGRQIDIKTAASQFGSRLQYLSKPLDPAHLRHRINLGSRRP